MIATPNQASQAAHRPNYIQKKAFRFKNIKHAVIQHFKAYLSYSKLIIERRVVKAKL